MYLPIPPDVEFWEQYQKKTQEVRDSTIRQLTFFARVHADIIGTNEIGLEAAMDRIVRWWNAGLVKFDILASHNEQPYLFLFVWDLETGKYFQPD